MSRGFPKSKYRQTSDPAAPFDSVLDELSRRHEAPSASLSPAHPAPAAPAGGWTYAAAETPAVFSSVAAAEMYVDPDVPFTTANRSVEEAVADELQLSDALEPPDLERIRRTFAYRNHPDRVGPAHKMQASRRMTVANVLIDQALKAAKARAR